MYRCGAHSAVTAVLASAVALMASTNATTIARGRQQIFRTGVDHVRVDVVVTDRADKPVAGLSAKDFIVLDRGVQQTIDEFEMAGVPPSAGTHSADSPPD